MKKLHAFVVLTAVFVAMLVAGAHVVLAQPDPHNVFQMLSGLQGNWVGKGSEGQPIEVSFRMTAGGSALMNEIHGEGHENMITMFHMDGDRLMMTHYCGVGNQPRMKLISADAKSASFEFFDGTNIKPGDGHMQRVTFAQAESGRHTEEWVFLDHGTEHKEVFTLERAK